MTSRRVVKEVRLRHFVGKRYVRALFAIEGLKLDAVLKAHEGDAQKLIAAQLAFYLSNADGSDVATIENADSLLSEYSVTDTARILRAGLALNRLDDDAVEDAAKN